MTRLLKTHTLGCKVNQYETELVREALTSFGYDDAANTDHADLCVINTCTVTNEGDSKSRQVIRRMARQNPDAKMIVMGCYATRAPDELRELPNVTEVVTDKRELPDLLGRFGVIDYPDGISRFSSRHRAYVKVQDGCLLKCSYCIIPKVRPQMASRPLQSIVDEVHRLVDNGHREIVLTGIHLGHYGVDWNWNKPKSDWTRLPHLLRALVAIPGDFRIRLSSIEATEVTRELVGILAEFPDRICPHFHVCLQSGSDRILRRMKRRWGAKRFVDRCALIRNSLHKPALTTDIIVGFPGETEEDFRASCDVSREVGFSKIHVFPFSARRDTPAATMEDQISKQEKSERVARLTEVETELRLKYFDSLVSERLQMMVETTADGFLKGTSCRYAPIQLPQSESHNNELQAGDLTDILVDSVSPQGTLIAKAAEALAPASSSE